MDCCRRTDERRIREISASSQRAGPHFGARRRVKSLGHGEGYEYVHESETGYFAQEYSPDELCGKKVYEPGLRITTVPVGSCQ